MKKKLLFFFLSAILYIFFYRNSSIQDEKEFLKACQIPSFRRKNAEELVNRSHSGIATQVMYLLQKDTNSYTVRLYAYSIYAKKDDSLYPYFDYVLNNADKFNKGSRSHILDIVYSLRLYSYITLLETISNNHQDPIALDALNILSLLKNTTNNSISIGKGPTNDNL